MNLDLNRIYHGRAENLIGHLPSESLALSVWSPPYFVGKDYEADETYETWSQLLRDIIAGHSRALRPGGFVVINIADILCFEDPLIPRFQAMNVAQHRSPVTRDMVIEARAAHPTATRDELASLLGCSEQTIDRRLNGNNIRGGKHAVQTRVKIVGGMIEQAGYDAGLYMYDHRIWIKDPAWANSRWTVNSLKAVSEFEHLYVLWKPGQYVIDRTKLSDREWREWGSRGLWTIRSVRSNDEHEAMFPLELAERAIRLFSDEGDTVLDPFMGSGTTAIAALKNARNFIGFEKERKYVELAENRVREYEAQGRLVF